MFFLFVNCVDLIMPLSIKPIIQVKGNFEFSILIAISVVVILLVLTFNLGKDSDMLDFQVTCVNNSIQYTISKRCNDLYSNMYSYCQYGSVYSEILLWGLFSTYCIQTKELQMIFPLIIGLLSVVCICLNIYINTQLWNNNNER